MTPNNPTTRPQRQLSHGERCDALSRSERRLLIAARVLAIAIVFAGASFPLLAEEATPEPPKYRVVFREPTVDVAQVVLPTETNQRIQLQYVGMMAFGLTIDNQKMLCCGAGAIRTVFKIDEKIVHPNVPAVGVQGGMVVQGGVIVQGGIVGPNGFQQGKPLPPDRNGKVRPGMQSSFVSDGIHITQYLEVVPSEAAKGAAKRPLDNMLIRYVFENKGNQVRKVGTRVRIDTMCGNNDGALFAAPTKPGEILNGIALEGKTLPEWVRIMEVPNLQNPGFHGHFTLKLKGNRIGPDKFVCTAHAGGDNGWDAPIVQSNGDSDCILYWTPRELRPGQKMEMAYAYGQGIASLPESEGRLKVSLGGNFEPGKVFNVQAFVEDPGAGQTLSLELPEGMSLLDGPPTQPAAPPVETQSTSTVLWRGRAERPGDFTIRVRSSNGVTESRTVSIVRE
jgi:hypothetical protein